MILSPRGCARCGGDHDDLEFEVLERPMKDPSVLVDDLRRVIATHWAVCPTSGQPIMARVKDEMDCTS